MIGANAADIAIADAIKAIDAQIADRNGGPCGDGSGERQANRVAIGEGGFRTGEVAHAIDEHLKAIAARQDPFDGLAEVQRQRAAVNGHR